MGGARNLKLGRRGGKSQGTGGNNFFYVWAQCRSHSVVVCVERCSGVLPLSGHGIRGGGEAPEAKTLLTFGRAMEATIFACRLIFGNAKKLTYVCVILQK